MRSGACMALKRAVPHSSGELTGDSRSFTAGCRPAKSTHGGGCDGEIPISRVLCGYGDSDRLGPGPIVAAFPCHTLRKEVTMTLLRRLVAVSISMGLILGCSSGSPVPKAQNAAPGRAETKLVEGASAVGYNGNQMRKKIDNVIDRAEERSEEFERGAAGMRAAILILQFPEERADRSFVRPAGRAGRGSLRFRSAPWGSKST